MVAAKDLMPRTIGRADILADIRAQIPADAGSASRSIRLYGLGGIGKTHVLNDLWAAGQPEPAEPADPSPPHLAIRIDLQSPNFWLPEGLIDEIADQLDAALEGNPNLDARSQALALFRWMPERNASMLPAPSTSV
mgnify:CR=1 FL=1